MIFGIKMAEISSFDKGLYLADVLIFSMLWRVVTKITKITRVFETKTQKRVKKG